MSIAPRAFICGCAGTTLSADEIAFIRQWRPWGLILFKRNIGAPVLIDQEGGRVQRMGPPHWPKYPPAAAFAGIGGVEVARDAASLMAADLRAVGVTVDCLPVLDVPAPDGHQIIGDRAYGPTPGVVSALGRAVAEAMLAGGVLPVIKHIPGHGRALADSHLELPVVHASRAELEATDFAPFRALADMPVAMTAHVVYTALDPASPATTSARVVGDIIRGHIGFDGLLMSDDMSMKALGGSFGERAAATFRAGVDLALHCNGDLRESTAVAEVAPILGGRSLERAERALSLIAGPRVATNLVDARARLDSAIAGLA